MNYKNMTKDDLIKKLESQQHLAQAIEAKDKEILKHIEEKLKMKEEIDTLINSNQGALKEMPLLKEHIKRLEESNKKLATIAKEKVNSAALYVNAFQGLMKSIQGTLDNTIELEALLSKNIKTGDR